MSRRTFPNCLSPRRPAFNRCRRRSSLAEQILPPGLARPQGPAAPRLLCSELVTLKLTGRGVAGREVTGILEEIAPDGACVQLEKSIGAGTTVHMFFAKAAEGDALTGSVVECLRQKDLGFFAEIQFTRGCVWSPERYRPLHLFDPSGLLASDDTTGEA